MWETDRAWNCELEDPGSGSFSDIVLNKTVLVALIKQLEQLRERYSERTASG